jgi:hypothetical protein
MGEPMKSEENRKQVFKEGTVVKWSSQAQGYTTTKVGTIVQVVPAGMFMDCTRFPALYKKSGLDRSHESYVVQVGSKFYWPIASKLELVEAPEEPVAHVGVNAARTKRERVEKAFADAWAQQGPDILGCLLYDKSGNERRRSGEKVTAREAEVAATVIQWLGSQVGSAFIDEVREGARRG